MKKLILSIAAATIFAVSAHAQKSIFNNPDNHSYFGVRVAGEVTCPGDVSMYGLKADIYKSGGGIEFGGIYNLPVVANFYVEPGLKLYYNTYSTHSDIADALEVSGISIKKFGMRVPVMAGYHFDFTRDLRVYLFTGPELEIGFTADGKVKSGRVSESENLYGEEGGMNRVDVLWGFGAGISYSHYYFGISGSVGMCNMLDDSETKFHENRVSFTLGYNF